MDSLSPITSPALTQVPVIPPTRWKMLGVVLVIAIALGIGTYFLLNKNCDSSYSADQTANWKTYRNEQYGFEFKYPETASNLGFDPYPLQTWNAPGAVIVRGDLEVNSVFAFFSLAVLENSLDPQNIYGTYGKVEGPVHAQVGSQMGYRYKEGDAGTNDIQIQTKLGTEKTLLISFMDIETSEYQGPRIDPKVFTAYRELQRQILSTFRFIPSTNSEQASPVSTVPADWKTYQNTRLGVEFSYPSATESVYVQGNVITIGAVAPLITIGVSGESVVITKAEGPEYKALIDQILSTFRFTRTP